MTVGELAVVRALADPLDKYVYLRDLRAVDEPGFFRLLTAHAAELLPIVYTPTVGDAATQYHALPLTPQGLYVTSDDVGRVAEVLAAWPHKNVSIVVVTDGERVLGLGDLGAGGLAISEGKILLYTTMAGVPPSACLPLCLDVGTDNETLLQDANYKGLRRARLRGPSYDALVEELVTALLARCSPHCVLQWEDFGAHNAFALLERYRHSMCCFNDDIQGTASVALAGLISALRCAGVRPASARLLFHGAGEAGTGIGALWALYLQRRHGVAEADARRSCYFMDSKGLLCASRKDAAAGALPEHKRPFAHDVPFQPTLLDAVRALRPTALIGVSAQAGAFDAAVLGALAAAAPRPIVFALSNPTALSECTAAEAVAAAPGRVIFASGSPFDDVPGGAPGGREPLRPSQANNAYIFPALGYGAALSRARTLPDAAFILAAEVLASMLSHSDLLLGRLFPPLERIRDVAARVAAAVAAQAVADGRGVAPPGVDAAGGWEPYVRAQMWSPPPLLDAKL